VPFWASSQRRVDLAVNTIMRCFFAFQRRSLGRHCLSGAIAKGGAIAYPNFNDSSEYVGLKIEWLKDLACVSRLRQ